MKTLLLALLTCLPLAVFASSTSKVNGSVRVESTTEFGPRKYCTNQPFEFLGRAERLVRHVSRRPDGVEHRGESGVELRRRHLEVDQSGHPRGVSQLVFEA